MWLSYSPFCHPTTPRLCSSCIHDFITQQHHHLSPSNTTIFLQNNTKVLRLSYPSYYRPTTPRLCGSHVHYFVTQQHQDCVALIPIILSPNNTNNLWFSFSPLYHPTTPRLFGSHSTILLPNNTKILQSALVSTTFSPSNAWNHGRPDRT